MVKMRLYEIFDRLRTKRVRKPDEIAVKLQDDLGNFTLRFRKPSPMQTGTIVGISQCLKKPGYNEEYLMGVIFGVLSELSLDGLNKSFWQSGRYSPDVLVTILKTIIKERK